MTPALSNSINYKNELYEQWKKYGENQSIKREFTDYQRNLKKKLRAAKNRFTLKNVDFTTL